uniref:large proline-rich protein BAG6 isoform X2 n=1 Tax=Myxine glutinosa TaxID=7769 RepID=UPI00358F1F17
MLDITVKTMDSQSRNFTVPEEITVLEFKERIAPLVHIVRNKQRLIYQGRVLQDDSKLKDYEVHGKVIHLVERSPPQAQPRSQGPASAGSASSGNQPNADLTSGRYMMMGAINVQPPNVQQLQQVLQQAAAEMGRNAHITSNTGVDGSLEIQVNFGTHPLMATGEARLCLVTTQRLLQDLLDVIRRLEGGAPVEAPMADADGEPGQSTENAPSGEPSEASSESTMGVGEQGPRAEQTMGSDGAASQESTAPPARPTELLQLLADVQDARSRLDPHLQRYQSLLGTAASADYNNNTEGREGDQRTLNLVADAFSILGRIFVNLSRLRCNLDSSAPRALFVPPGSLEQSPALVLPPGLLMQVGGALSGAAAAGGRPTEGQAGGPATQSTPGSSAETGEGPQAATDGSAGQGQASGPPRFVQIRHRLDPIVMMRYFPGMNGNFAATSTTQTPTTQNAGGNIPPNVSFVYTTDGSGSGQSGTSSQASTTTAAPMASSGPGGATLFQVPPPELMPGLIQISQQISQHALDASNGQARFTFQIPHRVMLSPQLAPTRGMAPFAEQRATMPQGADVGAENLARMIGRMMGQLVGSPAAPTAQQTPNNASAPSQTSTPNAQPAPGSSSVPAQTTASNNGQQTATRQGPSSQTSQTPPSQARQIDQTLLMQLVMQGAAWGLGVAARAIGGVVTGPRDDVGGVEGGAAAVGDFLRNYAELIVDTGVMGTASAGRQGTPLAENRATTESATPQDTGNAGTGRGPASGTGNVRLPGVVQTGQAFEEILSPEFMSMVVQAVLSTVLSSLGGTGAGSGAGTRAGAGSGERTTEPRQVPGGPGGRMAQENIASFIQRLSGASIVEAGAGFFSELLAVVCEGLSMADVVVLLHGSPGPLCHLRQNLVTFARERLLEGREPTDQNILEATDRLVGGMARYIRESFEGVAVREGVDIERANLEFLRENVNQLASHVLQSTENDQAFSQRLLDLCTRMLLEWLTLNRLCLRDGVSGVVSLINDHIRHLSAEVNPALVTWLTTMMESRIRSVMANMPTASEDVAVYMRHAPQAEGSEETAVSQKENELEEVDTEVTDGEGNLQSPPPATTAEEVAGRANPPSVMDTDMEGTGAAEMPGVAMGGEASGNGVVAAPDAEAWSSVVPPEWVPVIRQDLQCQRRLKPQAPLSDAYISGMPAKRRKTMQESEVTGCLSLSDALRRAARGAGVQPLTSLESLSADADNPTLQQAYRQQVKSDIKKRLREDSDYDPARFPNSRQLFDKP